MSESRNLYAPNVNLDYLSENLTNWFESEQFSTRQLKKEVDTRVVRYIQQESWRNLLGMSSGLTIRLSRSKKLRGRLTVEIWGSKWVDKIVVGVAGGSLTAGFLLIVVAYGAWQQWKLPQRTFERIQQYVDAVEDYSGDPETSRKGSQEGFASGPANNDPREQFSDEDLDTGDY